MNNKTDLPDSDGSARRVHPDAAEDDDLGAAAIPDLQTSNKSGKHSTVEKLAASRPEFGSGRGAQPVAGAFGQGDQEDHAITGRLAQPGTNQFHCASCGRPFDTGEDLAQHEPECRLAKAATASGREDLQK